ncbi:MAG: sugar transferase, partial [Lachnospiraceae bacterium]|nr:sugar transferase [Lachnospiraceae bacterium]
MNIKYIYRGLCGILLTVLYCASFFMVWYTFVRDHNQTGQLLGYGNLGMSTGIYLVMIFLLMRSLGGYQIGVHRMMRTIAGQIVTLLIADFVEIFISMAITGQFRFFFAFSGRYLGLFIAQSALTLLMSTGMIIMYQRVFPSLKMVEICGNFQNTLYEKIESRPDKYDIEEKIQYPENGEGLEEEIAKYDAVVVNDLPSEEKNKVLKLCFEMDKRVY